MTDPILFQSASPRFGLPLLFAGQAQKEFFVNEAHALADALMHCAIEGEASAPPVDPADGEAWLVGPAPTGEWAGREGSIASRQAGNWLFIAPRDGMRLLDRSTGQEKRYLGEWKFPSVPLEPYGGSIIDAEARVAISAIIGALRAAGILPIA